MLSCYPSRVLEERSTRLERIDTGDYTAEEYDRFLEDIRKVNRFAGDSRALKRSAIRAIRSADPESFSVLDVGAGSGELLRDVVAFARSENRKVSAVGLELNERSARSIRRESAGFPEISATQGNALALPFADDSFDYVISSLFAHHLTDSQIVSALKEMTRVCSREVFLIDLHRHPMALVAYKAFCSVFRISQLVRQDGSLSILRGFKPLELYSLGKKAGLDHSTVERSFPFRLVLRSSVNGGS